MTLKMPYYPELVHVFYNNLKIQDGVIFSEVHKIPIVVYQSILFIDTIK